MTSVRDALGPDPVAPTGRYHISNLPGQAQTMFGRRTTLTWNSQRHRRSRCNEERSSDRDVEVLVRRGTAPGHTPPACPLRFRSDNAVPVAMVFRIRNVPIRSRGSLSADFDLAPLTATRSRERGTAPPHATKSLRCISLNATQERTSSSKTVSRRRSSVGSPTLGAPARISPPKSSGLL